MREKRVFERIDAPMKIKYEVVDKMTEKSAAAKDISGGGIRLALSEELKEGTTLKLMIGIPGSPNKTASAYGTVVWTRHMEVMGGSKASGYYETGIRFTKADSLTLGLIFKHFQKQHV
jgi:c-di-GMP-binding flagellar brake protein YcgR